MKITKRQLRRIVREELGNLNETRLVAPGPWDDPEDFDDPQGGTSQQQQPMDRLADLPSGEQYEKRLHSSNPVLAEGNNEGWKNLVADLVVTATSFTRGWEQMRTVLDRHLGQHSKR